MRSPRLLLLVATASACADTGAHLTFVAPEGPPGAQAYRVVLAAPDKVDVVPDQRTDTSPAAASQTVTYYRQRTTAGESMTSVKSVDGLTLRIAPEGDFEGTTFVPFVLFYDGAGEITGIGTFHGSDTTGPAKILVLPDEIDKYEIAVEPVTQVTDTDKAAAGQVMVVDCYHDDQTPYASGIVWRPKAGGELRLLFPDDGGLDATGRELDLDCDAHPVMADSAGRDCDDSRAWFHRDAGETCDGNDTNCDGLQSLAVACPASSTNGTVCADAMTQTGIAICDDRTGTVGACQSDPGCLCAAGLQGCTKCKVSIDAGSVPGAIKPCQPGIGMLSTQNRCEAGACTVEVLAVRGPWKVEVAAPVASPAFGSRAQNVTSQFMIKAKAFSGELMATPGDPIGEVDLLISSGTAQHYVGVQLETLETPATCQGSNGTFAMQCAP